ncbi:hypothetical protein MLD38_038167 [Melastoma candidum]|uniref:Uncharacterized protein n=1 Tax=Melastoma candidum TaxID=119954 RepID=A0ACB9KYX4_9MYRT|nr:hypothetical protein MLD38_038167 [Melastoma candidum]
MGSTCRDRTSEFRSLSQTLRKIGGGDGGSQAALRSGRSARSLHQIGVLQEGVSDRVSYPRGFSEDSSACQIEQSSMFDYPAIEIQQLTVLIKDDVTAINTALQDLQAIQNLEMSDGRHLEDRAVHYTAVCDDLKGRLMGTTKQLQMSSPQELKT